MHYLWLLGDQLIGDVSLYDEYSIPAQQKLKDSVSLDGGPLCRYLSTEVELKAFDSTCRKLHKFLEANTQWLANQSLTADGANSSVAFLD
jgi:hypothetical protein